MTPERWQRIKQIASDALDLPAEARAAFVARVCAGDADAEADADADADALREDVLSLLAADDPSGRFLEPDAPPARIGVYRIVREIGRGGMGTVYEGARDDGSFEQRVAIKIITRGRDSEAVLRRFYAERQILARLQHPHIARLFDGGMTADGRPYFVMEYLEARPITSYCDEHRLSVDRRIDVFIAVCEAVEHAHSHLVLHRDLKPANILVDASGAPKLLDFGIAKLLDADHRDGTVTEIGQRAMTPKFASPEQRRGEPLTTASDVYALGLLLAELVPADRRRGDLARVARKAIEDEPSRRYTRAADLAEDLRRYRRNEPVTARPSGVMYRASKYAARHWRGLAVAAVALTIVAAAIANALVQGRRAERHFREVRQLANTLLFEFHDAIAKLPGATPARELVLTRAQQYLDGLSREAGADPGLTRELGESYLRLGEAQGLYFEANLGKKAEARANFEKALALFRDVARANPSDVAARTDVANATIRLATTFQESDAPRARALLEEAIRLLGDARLPANAGTASNADDPRQTMMLATAYTGLAENTTVSQPDAFDARNQAIGMYAALAKRTPPFPDSERFFSISLKRRAAMYLSARHDAMHATEDLTQAAVIDERRVALDPSSAVAKLDLALGDSYRSVALRQTGNFEGALAALTRAMTIRRDILHADPQNVRVRGLLAGDDAKLAALITALRETGGHDALLHRAEELAKERATPPAAAAAVAVSARPADARARAR